MKNKGKEVQTVLEGAKGGLLLDSKKKGNYWYAGIGVATTLMVGLMGAFSNAYAEDKFRLSIDDTKWIKFGAGFRGTGRWVENQTTSDGVTFRNNFGVDNARLYVDGQVHQYVKFTINTECFFCSDGGGANGGPTTQYNILDAIGKVEINRHFNIWGGRMLVPTERGELNGPFYHATHDGFKTPFFSQDFSIKFGSGGAGRYGRDDGGTFWGSIEPGFVKGTLGYAVGVYRGLQSSSAIGPNQRDDVLWAGRFTYNFLNPEENPGYYTSGTYFGKAGDILALAFGASYQKNGAGSFDHRSDFLGLVGDVLYEKVLPRNTGVFTVNGEYKQFYANYSPLAFADPSCFCMFNGKSWSVTGLYLIPVKVGIGQFQPYGRFTSVQPNHSSNREEIEGGVNYIINGFNARISAYYQYGDLFTKGLNYAPGLTGEKVDIFKLSFQLQM